MTGTNALVADALRRYAAALSLEGANRFKVRAYRRAAETIEDLQRDVRELVDKNEDLTKLPGIGKAINDAVVEIVRSGKLGRLERTTKNLKPEIAELAEHPLLDARKITRIYKKLGISNLEELRKSLEQGTIGKLLGPRLEYHVRQGLDERPRHLLHSVESVAEKIENYLRSLPSVTAVSPAGSLRRKKDTVGDLNFLVAGPDAAAIFREFDVGGVLSSEARGERQRLFNLSSRLTVVLHWTPAEEWGLELLLATGSPLHLAELGAWAAHQKIALSKRSLSAKRISLDDEANVYQAFGLSFIEPELREGRGEVRAAATAALPHLVQVDDIRGDLHAHTVASDGVNTIEEMAAAAEERGYEYLAITDHSQSLRLTNGLSEDRLREQIRLIDRINNKLKGIRILKSAEVDILHDGRLDYPDELLKELDFTICSIHSKFSLDKAQQTERILRAMDNRYFNILGHATGRLLLRRPGYELDMQRIMDHAKAGGCFFEINSNPDRLDLSDEHAKLAKEHGVKIAINTDAHSIHELELMPKGINQARRGWLEPADVLNTKPLKSLLAVFRR